MLFFLRKIKYPLIDAKELNTNGNNGSNGCQKEKQEYEIAVGDFTGQVHRHGLIDNPENGGTDKQEKRKAQ